jgi:hypothetical protein
MRHALQVLVTARTVLTKDRTRAFNALTTLVPQQALSMETCKALRSAPVLEMSRWRARKEELVLSVT